VLSDPAAGDPAHAGITFVLEQMNALAAKPIHDVSRSSFLMLTGSHPHHIFYDLTCHNRSMDWSASASDYLMAVTTLQSACEVLSQH
jgi:hypothetical protein